MKMGHVKDSSTMPCLGIPERVNYIPTMQFLTGVSINIQSKSYMLSLTDCIWEFRDDVLFDTH